MLLALGFVGLYVVLVGVASFVEKPVTGHLDAFQFTAALRTGGMILAVATLLAAHGLTLPGLPSTLAGLGIGLISGIGSLLYCYAIGRLPVWLVTCLANAYIIVTVILGVIVLHDPLTPLKIVGLVLTVAGMFLLSYRQGSAGTRGRKEKLSLLAIAGYVLLVGMSTFLEKPALRYLDALQLNALAAVGMALVGMAALLVFDRHLPRTPWAFPATGIGMMMALGAIFYYLGLNRLPISVVAPIANTYVLIPLVLSVLFRHQTITWTNAAGILATLLGVTLLAMVG